MDSLTVIKKISRDGWILLRTAGSHHIFRHPNRPGYVNVPHPKKELPVGTLRDIEKKSGLKLR